MRILKFSGAFLITLLVIFFIVFGFNFQALQTLFRNSNDLQEGQEWVAATSSLKGLTEYIGAHPDRVSIASLSIEDPDSAILYNEHAPRTMARLVNILYLVEYARQVDNGALDPDELIPIDSVNRYQLPYKDENTHKEMVNALRNEEKITREGFIRLEDLVQASLAYNDLALSDFLFFRLGIGQIEELMNDLGLKATELPLPFSGLYIEINPHLHGKGLQFQSHLDSLSSLDRDVFHEEVINNSKRFTADGPFREEVLSTFRRFQGLGIQFTEERNALALHPKTTALEMAGLMSSIQKETLLSESISRRVKSYLDWPMETSQMAKSFQQYGAIYDNRMGMANGIDFGTSGYTGDSFAQAVFFDELQIAFWFHMTSNLMHQDFQQRLMWDPALWDATKGVVSVE